MRRFVFILSDGTGITADTLANSLISQFETISFDKITIPYIDTETKAQQIVQKINAYSESNKTKPLVFMTLVDPKIRGAIMQADATIFDLFNSFIEPLETELDAKSSYTVGRSHGVVNPESYNHRIDAVNFALNHDDGIKISHYEHADIILVGVSRCGKTPSCLFMALQFGIYAANYPFTEDDFDDYDKVCLPSHLAKYKDKLFGLTIDPQRLEQIRSKRRANSTYASSSQCEKEVREVEAMYKKEKIPYIDSTKYSIEEISTRIMARAGIKRRII